VSRASLTPSARDMLLADVEIPVVSLEDLYGGKLVAAMDRQHPRDLFDVMQLFAHEGITRAIRRAFVIYQSISLFGGDIHATFLRAPRPHRE